MKVIEFYRNSPIYSLEVFPPRNGEPIDGVFSTIESLREFKPAYISVTCGASGTPRGGTVSIAAKIKREYGIESVIHLTCSDKSKQDIENLLTGIKYEGIENILALRGDPSQGEEIFLPHEKGHTYASGFVEQISLMNKGKYLTEVEGAYRQGLPTNFCISVAGYPEGHPECSDKKKDLEHLKIKVDKGADYIITQMFFDVNHYLKFVKNVEGIGIDAPIIPGVMPLEEYSQITYMLQKMKISIPRDFMEKLEKNKSDKHAVQKICTEHTVDLCKTLIREGAPGIHFYTMNRLESTRRILQQM